MVVGFFEYYFGPTPDFQMSRAVDKHLAIDLGRIGPASSDCPFIHDFIDQNGLPLPYLRLQFISTDSSLNFHEPR